LSFKASVEDFVVDGVAATPFPSADAAVPAFCVPSVGLGPRARGVRALFWRAFVAAAVAAAKAALEAATVAAAFAAAAAAAFAAAAAVGARGTLA